MRSWFSKNGTVLGNYIFGFALLIIFSIIFRNFGSISHISVLMSDLAILGFLALGQTFPVLTGGIDMSLSYTMCSVAVAINYCTNTYHLSLGISILIGFLLAICIGLINGFGVAYLRVHPMIMTYGMNSVLMGLLLTWTGGTAGGNTADALFNFAKAQVGFVPVITLLFVAAVVILTLLLTRSAYGKRLYAVGNSRLASYYSGVHVRKVVMITYVISAVCVAIGGIFLSGRVGLTYLGMGDSYMFTTLAVVAIGGVSMNGGSGNVIGTAGGAIIITILLSVLTVINVSNGMQQLLYGVVLLIAIVLEANSSKIKFVRRRKQNDH